MSDATTQQAGAPHTPKLRTGRHLGRTLYLQVSPDPTARDVYLGIFDSVEIATLIAIESNRNQWLLNEIATKCGHAQ